MKTILIILGAIAALALFGLVWPLLAAAGIAWLCFGLDATVAGVVVCVLGVLCEIGYLIGIFSGGLEGSSRGFDDGDPAGPGISWGQAFTALYVIDHLRNRDE